MILWDPEKSIHPKQPTLPGSDRTPDSQNMNNGKIPSGDLLEELQWRMILDMLIRDEKPLSMMGHVGV